jgi:hypothetical protein
MIVSVNVNRVNEKSMNQVNGENQCDYSPIRSRKPFPNLKPQQKQCLENQHSLQKGEKPGKKRGRAGDKQGAERYN